MMLMRNINQTIWGCKKMDYSSITEHAAAMIWLFSFAVFQFLAIIIYSYLKNR